MTLEELNEKAANRTITGIYELDSRVYHDAPGISNSGLSLLARSPKHYHYHRNSGIEREPTPAQEFGTLVHCAILEPEKFEAEYFNYDSSDKIDRRTTAGKLMWEELLNRNKGKKLVRGDLYRSVLEIREAVMDQIALKDSLITGKAEQSIFWADEQTGVLCKARLDLIDPNGSIGCCIIDLKTTEDARKESFEKSAFNYRYHVQAAYYLHGLNQLGIVSAERFMFVAIEKSPPYEIGIYEIDNLMLELGQKTFRKNLDLYSKCVKEDRWPGLPEEVQEMSLPPFALNMWEDL